MDDVRVVAKGDRNDHFGFNFRGIDAVVNAVGPVLRRHQVVVVPMVESIDYRQFVNPKKQTCGLALVTVRYRFHGPAGDHLDAVVVGESIDTSDKAVPKAMSVAFRTALLQSLALPTTEPDPDSESPERAAASDPDWLKDAVKGISDSKTAQDLETVAEFIKAGRAAGKCSDADAAALRAQYVAAEQSIA